MSLPLQGVYPTRQELVAAVDAFAEANHYHVVRDILSKKRRMAFGRNSNIFVTAVWSFESNKSFYLNATSIALNAIVLSRPLLVNAAMALAEIEAEDVDVVNNQPD